MGWNRITMDKTQIEPVRRLRRWPVVAFVLVLVSMVSWWNWPRGDARFVGTWQLIRDDGPLPAFMIFDRSGGGRTVDISGKSLTHFSWEFDGRALVYRPPLGLGRSRWLTEISGAMRKYLGTSLLAYEERAEVITLTGDLLNTRLSRSGNSFNLQRVRTR
ncbi:hypothetical protein Pan44_31320 [Caulifigura coniformis]|uniref:Lipocalin-like domain-containing protein n=1 Tax=Caulifigura coniformis TaxID=2527983 RepID=A0A517SG41_9PLAN|nr:hypothetical protein [Caulifigura coniformis]QDT55091.1 hypothetical protein Pan44_31320 [Caulifigura coniformis]